jgi:hypothetical protein
MALENRNLVNKHPKQMIMIADTVANRHAILDAIKRLSAFDLPKEPDDLIAYTYLRGGTLEGWTAELRRRNGSWCVSSVINNPFVGTAPRIEEDYSSWDVLMAEPKA